MLGLLSASALTSPRRLESNHLLSQNLNSKTYVKQVAKKTTETYHTWEWFHQVNGHWGIPYFSRQKTSTSICDQLNNGAQRSVVPNLWHMGKLRSMEKESLHMGLSQWFWDDSGLSTGVLSAIMIVLTRGRPREVRHGRRECGHRNRDWTDVARSSQGMPAATGSLESKERWSLRASGGSVALPTPWFWLSELISDFWLPELRNSKCRLFGATEFAVICYSSHRKHTQLVGHEVGYCLVLSGWGLQMQLVHPQIK